MSTTDGYRLATEADYFPYGWPGKTVCYIHIADDGVVRQFRYRDDLRSFLANPTGRLFAAWPGEWRTDLFLIDPAVMAEAIEVNA